MENSQENHIPAAVLFGTAAVEEHTEVLEPAHPAQVSRRRGRPPGSKTRVAHNHVTADEFAWLRATAQGLDLSVTANLYLLWPGRPPERQTLEVLHAQLLRRIEAGARGIDDQTTARAMVRELLDWQTLPSTEACSTPPTDVHQALPPASTPPPAIPSLEEFAARFDPDFFSEAELIERYAEEFGDTTPEPSPKQRELGLGESAPATEPELLNPVALAFGERVKRRLNAIDWLSERLGVVPGRLDPLEQWLKLNAEQRMAFHKAGVLTLGDFVDWMALRGPRWHDDIPRFGKGRAEALRLWLARWDVRPRQGLALPLAVSRNPSCQLTEKIQAPYAHSPLTRANWPAHLRGEFGYLRSNAPNSFRAPDDPDAVEKWFELIQQKSPQTQRAYRRAIELLVRWAQEIRNQPLSSMSTKDLLAFKAFLRNPPDHWVQDPKKPRNAQGTDKRPLRGPLSDKSLEQTLVVVRLMYASWASKGYISSDPAKEITVGKRRDSQMDVMRFFSEQQQEVIARTYTERKDGPGKRRLLAIIRLAETAGLRRNEISAATWDRMRPIRINGRDTDQWSLLVRGKGQKERSVPISAGAYEALLAHREDRLSMMGKEKGKCLTPPIDPAQMPLIGVLDERWIETLDKRLGALQAMLPANYKIMDEDGDIKLTVNRNGALSGSTIYAIIKKFFLECSINAGESLSDPHTTFKKASTHWLRHTFAHAALRASGKDLTTVQALMGHASITTTALYTKADMESRTLAVNAIKPSI